MPYLKYIQVRLKIDISGTCLACVRPQCQSSVLNTVKLSMVVHLCNPSVVRLKQKGLKLQDSLVSKTQIKKKGHKWQGTWKTTSRVNLDYY